jgi:hypothetical protein
LVNANLLVKYNQPDSQNEANTSDTSQPENSDEEMEENPSTDSKRKYTKRKVEKRADGGPLTRSRAKFEKEIELTEIEPDFDYYSAPGRHCNTTGTILGLA